jgi:hypothetical protein
MYVFICTFASRFNAFPDMGMKTMPSLDKLPIYALFIARFDISLCWRYRMDTLNHFDMEHCLPNYLASTLAVGAMSFAVNGA